MRNKPAPLEIYLIEVQYLGEKTWHPFYLNLTLTPSQLYNHVIRDFNKEESIMGKARYRVAKYRHIHSIKPPRNPKS